MMMGRETESEREISRFEVSYRIRAAFAIHSTITTSKLDSKVNQYSMFVCFFYCSYHHYSSVNNSLNKYPNILIQVDDDILMNYFFC